MNKQKIAIITIGCSGSGKSTFARKHAAERRAMGESWFIIERDEVRKSLRAKSSNDVNFWSEWSFKNEHLVNAEVDARFQTAFAANANIIVSDTNLNQEFRRQLITRLSANGYTVQIEHFNVQYKKLLENDNKRADSVGQQVIQKQYFQYMEQFGDMFGYKKVKETFGNPSCILVDIDGTLAHMNGKRGPFEWDKVGVDDVDHQMSNIVRMYHEHTDIDVIIMSGRDGSCREQTVQWLHDMGIEYDQLYMRKAGDMRSDFDVKNEIIQTHINGRWNVEAWFDDRPQIVRLAHVLGVKIFAVGNQHEEF